MPPPHKCDLNNLKLTQQNESLLINISFIKRCRSTRLAEQFNNDDTDETLFCAEVIDD